MYNNFLDADLLHRAVLLALHRHSLKGVQHLDAVDHLQHSTVQYTISK